MLEVGIGCRRHILNCKKRHNQKRRKNGQQFPPFDVAVETENHIERLRRRQHARQRGGLAVRRHQVRQHGHYEYAEPETAHPLDKTCASAKQYQPDNYRKIHIVNPLRAKVKRRLEKSPLSAKNQQNTEQLQFIGQFFPILFILQPVNQKHSTYDQTGGY